MTNKVTLIATAAMGLEAIVAKEIRELGYGEVTVENGKVIFEADIRAIPRCNLWLRTADRLKLQVGEFHAYSYDELFEQTKALPWEQFIPEDGSFPVTGKSHKSKLYSVPDCQSIVKKAIVEKLKQKHGIASWLQETGATYKIEVALLKDKVSLTIDTSGAGLHKRGYRVNQGEAPLKETLAAALVKLTNWRYDEPFYDLFCGSGTIPIEAALIGQNIAPGFNRSFAAEEWGFIPSSLWDQSLEEAEDLAEYDKQLTIFGSDLNPKMTEISRENALEAGLADLIEWKQMQATDFHSKLEGGYIVSNPPYGERIGDKQQVEAMYTELGKVLKDYPTWNIYILTANEQFEQLFGRKASKKRKLFNAFIRTDYYQYFGQRK
ncbi:THUMP domain-containing class I SAM-dependent RNA methyltransferase [Gracilibacillus alcaliphilus]|uniref:THUMP domain-containing class I SAM-dependent RNA methyltransferase n=1 Tax=Gracilibacillus alcaliphilus TaxID=1401441 RepID=UPI0019577101|nr:class I SAM-dependent RNA methyltransferase [Gracilibacillus alcaliphilus]MBM7675231.1 putative N6-adenine-specific DNA methylase [Gracilibacillus alcaliphilus]